MTGIVSLQGVWFSEAYQYISGICLFNVMYIAITPRQGYTQLTQLFMAVSDRVQTHNSPKFSKKLAASDGVQTHNTRIRRRSYSVSYQSRAESHIQIKAKRPYMYLQLILICSVESMYVCTCTCDLGLHMFPHNCDMIVKIQCTFTCT